MRPTTPESVGVTPPELPPELPLWRTWEGNDRFYCAGRCMTGPSPRNLLGTFLIVSVPSAMFNALVVPDVASATHVAVLAVGIAWPLWCLGNLLATGTSDPGIVRRRGPHHKVLISVGLNGPWWFVAVAVCVASPGASSP